ncbi:MAG: hypothetical protein AB9917_14110 [Negativicutes bacterium]
MNKLKVLYDVVTVMKNKEAFNGILTVQVHKDEESLFFLQNEFKKNLLTGETKAKINTDLNYEGKTLKHESTTEFTMLHSGECKCHEFFRNLHQCHAAGCGGLRGKLAKLAFAFSILNALQVSEQDSKTIVLSLKSSDLPEDIKALIHEKMSQASTCHHEHGFLKEFCATEQRDFGLNIFVNKNFEAEKIVITLAGLQKTEQNAPRKLTARAEVSFTW